LARETAGAALISSALGLLASTRGSSSRGTRIGASPLLERILAPIHIGGYEFLNAPSLCCKRARSRGARAPLNT